MTLSAEDLDGVASDEEPGTYGLGFFVSVVDERRNGHPHRHPLAVPPGEDNCGVYWAE